MNRTAVVAAVAVFACALPSVAQTPPAAAERPAQADPIDDVVAAMRAAEGSLKSVAMQLSTSGVLPGELPVTTRGVLHVLRGEQAAIHANVEFAFDDGIRGRFESAQTAAGIVMYEDNPAFGEVFVQFSPELVAELAWAGEVLQRDDLPGMADRRASSPLGSAMVAGLRRQFVLAVDGERKERNGEAGTWLAGKRKPGLDVQDPDLPVADAVELFVRASDQALLEVRHLQGQKTIQHLVVDKLEVNVELPPKTFEVDGGGQTLRPVEQHQPLWEEIKQVLAKARSKMEQKMMRYLLWLSFPGMPPPGR
jgi:hypothetical protein